MLEAQNQFQRLSEGKGTKVSQDEHIIFAMFGKDEGCHGIVWRRWGGQRQQHFNKDYVIYTQDGILLSLKNKFYHLKQHRWTQRTLSEVKPCLVQYHTLYLMYQLYIILCIMYLFLAWYNLEYLGKGSLSLTVAFIRCPWPCL